MKNEFEAWKFFEYIAWAFLVSSAASIVTFLANLMEAKDKRRSIDIIGLLIEAAFCSLFGTLMGVSVYLITDSTPWGFFSCSIFGMFGEKFYRRMSNRAETVDVGDFMNLNTILTDEDEGTKNEAEEIIEVKVKGKKYFIGCSLNRVSATAYNGWNGELRSPNKDIDFLKSLAIQNGYEVYRCFVDGGATNTDIIEALSSLARIVNAEDKVIFAYSGHGGQSEQEGIFYETICLFDGQMWEVNLRYLLGRIPCHVVGVFDCCHSGGLARSFMGLKGLPKSMPRNAQVILSHRIDLQEPIYNTTFLAACSKNEVAYDGENNGFFTDAIKQIVQGGGKKMSYRYVVEKAKELIGVYQHPNVEGTNKDDLFFD